MPLSRSPQGCPALGAVEPGHGRGTEPQGGPSGPGEGGRARSLPRLPRSGLLPSGSVGVWGGGKEGVCPDRPTALGEEGGG